MTDASLEGSQAICENPSKTRMSTKMYWEGGRGQLRELGVGGWGVPPFVMLPWNPVTKAAGWPRGDALPTGFPFLDASWVCGNYQNTLSLTLVDRWVAVILPKHIDAGPFEWGICNIPLKYRKKS